MTTPELVIEGRRPGLRPTTFLKVAFVVVWCVIWYRQGGEFHGGLSLNSAFVVFGLVVGLFIIASLIDHSFTSFRLEITQETVVVKRRSPFRSRQWSSPRAAFSLGPIDVPDDGDGKPGIRAHRHVRLHLGSERVPFMEGHPDPRLRQVHTQIRDWLAQNARAD